MHFIPRAKISQEDPNRIEVYATMVNPSDYPQFSQWPSASGAFTPQGGAMLPGVVVVLLRPRAVLCLLVDQLV